jgi:glutathione S-transferase
MSVPRAEPPPIVVHQWEGTRELASFDPDCLAVQFMLRVLRLPFVVRSENSLNQGELPLVVFPWKLPARPGQSPPRTAPPSSSEEPPLDEANQETACEGWAATVQFMRDFSGGSSGEGTGTAPARPDLHVDRWLSRLELAECEAFKALVRSRLAPAVLFHRFAIEKNWKAVEAHVSSPLSLVAGWFVARRLRRHALEKLPGETRFTREGTLRDARELFLLIDARLADRPFFFGKAPSTLDCVAFGFLASIMLFPQPDDALQSALCDHPNLVRYVNATQDVFFAPSRDTLLDVDGLPVFTFAEHERQDLADADDSAATGRESVLAGSESDRDWDGVVAGGERREGNRGYIPPKPRFEVDRPKLEGLEDRASERRSVLFVVGSVLGMLAYIAVSSRAAGPLGETLSKSQLRL